ncbi:MAG: ATP-binding protein [Roseburia sp.]|nr:ATP-binding protein [Roseburia sp.]
MTGEREFTGKEAEREQIRGDLLEKLQEGIAADTFFRNIVEDSEAGVYVADKKTRTILYANAAFSRICEMDVGKFIGKSQKELLETYGRTEFLTKEDIMELPRAHFSEFKMYRRGHYFSIRAKAITISGMDAYMMYVTDETKEQEQQVILKKNLEEMRQNQLKEKTLLASIPGGIAVYRLKKDGRVVVDYASEGFADTFGYTPDECMKFDDIMVHIAKDDVEMARSTVKEAISHQKSIHAFFHVKTKAGEICPTRVDANVMTEAIIGENDEAVLYAVHTRTTEEFIRTLQEQRHYRRVINMLGIAYWEWNVQAGFYCTSNYYQYAISEVPFEELRKNLVDEKVVHPDDREILKEFLAQGELQKGKCSAILRMLMCDGSYQWTEIIGLREYDGGEDAVRISCILRDVNQEWIRQKKALQDALEEAKQANAAKTAFISRISHDMRTPLNGILGMTSFLKETIQEGQAARDIQQLEASSQYLLSLINDTLDISRIENGKLELHPVVCDGKRVLEEVLRLLRPSIEAKHIQFEVRIEEIPFTVLYVDIARVEQIIVNIVGNAVKFTPEHGKIEFVMKRISEENGVAVDRIMIRDTGIGMSKDFLPHIFEAFSQEEHRKAKTSEGTGLGMPITKNLVDLMGGSIEVESEIGKGSCFMITLPIKIASEEQVARWKEESQKKEEEDVLINKRILVCEDHPLNREIVTRLLIHKKMRVEVAENGKVGEKMFEHAPLHYYDAILMDIQMPVMDGMEATRAIRALHRPDAKTVPIIAMTGNSFDEDVKKSFEAGMNAHLSKPIDAKKLVSTLITEIGKKE